MARVRDRFGARVDWYHTVLIYKMCGTIYTMHNTLFTRVSLYKSKCTSVLVSTVRLTFCHLLKWLPSQKR